MKHLFLFFGLLLPVCSIAETAPDSTLAKYWIEFTDKDNTPYSIFEPWEFLSPRAIERRKQQGIAVTETDLPVNPTYVQAIAKQGAVIHHTSKWLNAATVVADSLTIAGIRALPFVQKTEYVGVHHPPKAGKKKKGKSLEPNFEPLTNPYGYGVHQILMMNGHVLHLGGFKGEDKLVAVLDGGFVNVDEMPFFDSLRTRNAFYQGRDFVDNDLDVFESSTHGSQVLSVMGSNVPGLFIGTAPGADFVCVKTEDTRSEFLVEECNWVAGAEYADSIGADIINSSLGYTAFNDKLMNYTYNDMTGEVSRATRAADIAFTKGMVVVNSAGNSGNGWWKYVGAPADGKNVLSIGATDDIGDRAAFSSFGPSADGRIKPNISAMGRNITVASVNGYRVHPSNGTSFSAPAVAGMIATLWSAFPEKTNQEIFDAMEMSGSLADNPDNELGYGIPDLVTAYQYLSGDVPQGDKRSNIELIKPAFGNDFQLMAIGLRDVQLQMTIRNTLGKVIDTQMIDLDEPVEFLELPSLKKLSSGTYQVEIKLEGKSIFKDIFPITNISMTAKV